MNVNMTTLATQIVPIITITALVGFVLIPIIDEGSYDSKAVDNTPLTYEAFLSGSALTGAEIDISYGTDLTVAINGTEYVSPVSSVGYNAIITSDGINVLLGSGGFSVYQSDGTYLDGVSEISKTASASSFTAVVGQDEYVYSLPSYAYISIGLSDTAKANASAALYNVGSDQLFDSSSILMMMGEGDGCYGVTQRNGTVSKYSSGPVSGGIIIDANQQTTYGDLSNTAVIISVPGQDGHGVDYKVDDGSIQEVGA